jgi:LmbE family N-acetylglucosaminyl deacetylase
MATEFEFSFTVKQIEAVLKALEECGINSGSFHSMLEHFRDPELIRAAQAAHNALRRKSQKQSRPVAQTLALELDKDSVVSELRASLRQSRQSHAELLSDAVDLLTAVHTLRAAQTDDALRAARRQLDDALGRIGWSESDLAQRLSALENG